MTVDLVEMPVNACAPGRRVRRDVQYADGLIGAVDRLRARVTRLYG